MAVACQVPDSLIPNGDATNETFCLVGTRDWSLQLHNRRGQLIYRKQGYDSGWSTQAQSGGNCYYLLVNRASGQRLRGYLEIVR